MMVPFISLYLTDSLDFTLDQVAWVLSAFGLGSLAGSWLGGQLTDRFGPYWVMFVSLFSTGLWFIFLQWVNSFEGLLVGFFILLLLADSFRPASQVAINSYSKPEDKARSVSLIRLAINLGFAVGPAVGGILIASIGYGPLFWVDGLTCMLSGIVFLVVLKAKDIVASSKSETTAKASPWKDGPYLLFLLVSFIIGFAFLQLFTTVPLYYRDVHFLSEDQIGVLMAFSGILIFVMEMPMISYFDQPKRFKPLRLLIASTLLLALSFLVLNASSWVGMVWIGMFLLTIGEMLNFPFLAKFALDRAERGNSGNYMALYTMSFSLSHIAGTNGGIQLVDAFGYEFTWYTMFVALLLAAFLLYLLQKKLYRETTEQQQALEAS